MTTEAVGPIYVAKLPKTDRIRKYSGDVNHYLLSRPYFNLTPNRYVLIRIPTEGDASLALMYASDASGRYIGTGPILEMSVTSHEVMIDEMGWFLESEIASDDEFEKIFEESASALNKDTQRSLRTQRNMRNNPHLKINWNTAKDMHYANLETEKRSPF